MLRLNVSMDMKFLLSPSIKEVTMKTIFTLLALVAIVGISIAASMRDSDTAKPAAAASPHGAASAGKTDATMPPDHPSAIPADTNLVNSGEVLEVIDSPMYTYLQVTSDKGPLWLAVFKTDIVKGTAVRYSSGVAMSGFYSKSLDRTFDTIIFVDSIAPEKK